MSNHSPDDFFSSFDGDSPPAAAPPGRSRPAVRHRAGGPPPGPPPPNQPRAAPGAAPRRAAPPPQQAQRYGIRSAPLRRLSSDAPWRRLPTKTVTCSTRRIRLRLLPLLAVGRISHRVLPPLLITELRRSLGSRSNTRNSSSSKHPRNIRNSSSSPQTITMPTMIGTNPQSMTRVLLLVCKEEEEE